MAELTLQGLAALIFVILIAKGGTGRGGIILLALFASALPLADTVRDLLLTVLNAIIGVFNTVGSV